MSARIWHARPLRLALLLAASLLAVVGLALAGSLLGCGGQPESLESTGRPSQAVASSRPGSVAHATAAVFAQSTHPRIADTWGEIRAREFVYGAFQQYGYIPRMEEFIAGEAGRRVHSADIVAVKSGKSAEQLIVAANYDAIRGEGYVDNAVGVGLLLELAARVKDRETPYTLVFVALGAEKPRLLGSQYYAGEMTAVERRGTVGMINLDAVAGGDFLYVYSRPDEPAWLRDDILAAAQGLGIPLKEVPAHGGAAAGTVTVAGSDTALVEAGVVTAGLTSGNWEAEPAVGDAQTAEYGRISGTRRDTVQFVEEKYPGRVQRQLSDLARLLEVILTSRLEKRP
jgi:alkaline phosphatase isozyme conversion protein